MVPFLLDKNKELWTELAPAGTAKTGYKGNSRSVRRVPTSQHEVTAARTPKSLTAVLLLFSLFQENRRQQRDKLFERTSVTCAHVFRAATRSTSVCSTGDLY